MSFTSTAAGRLSMYCDLQDEIESAGGRYRHCQFEGDEEGMKEAAERIQAATDLLQAVQQVIFKGISVPSADDTHQQHCDAHVEILKSSDAGRDYLDAMGRAAINAANEFVKPRTIQLPRGIRIASTEEAEKGFTYGGGASNPKCECGASAVGSPGHSTWCPLWRQS